MTPHDLVDRYVAAWNETDGARRRALLERTFMPAAVYLDPVMEGEGPAGIDAMLGAVQARFPGYRLARLGEVEDHHGRLRFRWSLAPEGGPPLVTGTDFAVVAADGRLEAVTGFFDTAPAVAA